MRKAFIFINPKGVTKDKPTQIWTQGETEASSCWFPNHRCSKSENISRNIYYGS